MNPRIITSRSGIRGTLVNAETRERIPLAFYANLDTGEWKAWAPGPDGKEAVPRRIVTGKCRLEFIVGKLVIPMLKPTPAIELRASMLDAIKTFSKGPRPARRLSGVLFEECDAPNCHRQATHEVIDEREIDPQVTTQGASERAVRVWNRRYCEWHYCWPTFTNRRGVTREVETVVRPS